MTYDELSNEVLTLLGEGEVAKPLMVCSINHALRDIHTRKSIIRTVMLYASGLMPTYYRKQLYCQGGSEIIIPLVGKAYSMRISGEGMYKITDGGKTTIIEFKTGTESRVVRGFIERGGELKLYGYASFMVFDLSIYGEVFSTRLEDLPDGGAYVSFDIRGLHDDFLSFVSPARDGYGKEIEGCYLSDGRLYVPKDYRGEIQLDYRIAPTAVQGIEGSGETPSEEIIIPGEYQQPLILLSAYYYVFPKNAPLAERLMLQYERMMEMLDGRCYDKIDVSYDLKVRWA